MRTMPARDKTAAKATPGSSALRDSFDAAFDAAEQEFRGSGDADRLFDLRMLRVKLRNGIPGDRPATLADVPHEKRVTVEDVYREAAEEAGRILLANGDIPAAWSYFQAIRKPEPIREAIEQTPIVEGFDDRQQELTQIALYEMAHPRRGVEMLLAGSGICNTVTSLDQVLPQLSVTDRKACAAVIVGELHSQLLASVRADAAKRTGDAADRLPATLDELLQTHPDLLENGVYHADVSHLAAVVRFARSLDRESDALRLAIDLCRYGKRLDRPLIFEGEPPFEDLYVSHEHFLAAIADPDSADDPLDYFRKKLAAEPDARDRPLLAYVLTDLLMRTGRGDEAVEVARVELAPLGEQTGFSFAELCREAGRLDTLADYAREQGDRVLELAAQFGSVAAAGAND